DFRPPDDGSPPLSKAVDWVATTDPDSGAPALRDTDTMPGWAGSCWYYLRFMDPKCATAPLSPEAEDYWGNVDLYVGGAEHAVLHLLYARFWHKVLFDEGLVPTKEPFQRLFNQGLLQAFAFKDESGRLVSTDEVDASAELYLSSPRGRFVYLHGITGSSALRLIAPWLDTDGRRVLLHHTIHALLALHATHGDGGRPGHAPHDPSPFDPVDAAARAASSGEDHTIKLVEALLRERAHAPRRVLESVARHRLRA
ncbi:MAG: hypothetical protein K0V04_13910, partial [Deltaproteobacteria bacterium]|nr:hypothetical protein [Deltaproteobacteria bacterium]